MPRYAVSRTANVERTGRHKWVDWEKVVIFPIAFFHCKFVIHTYIIVINIYNSIIFNSDMYTVIYMYKNINIRRDLSWKGMHKTRKKIWSNKREKYMQWNETNISRCLFIKKGYIYIVTHITISYNYVCGGLMVARSFIKPLRHYQTSL